MGEGLNVYHVYLDKDGKVYYTTCEAELAIHNDYLPQEAVFIAQRVSCQQAQRLAENFSRMDFAQVVL